MSFYEEHSDAMLRKGDERWFEVCFEDCENRCVERRIKCKTLLEAKALQEELKVANTIYEVWRQNAWGQNKFIKTQCGSKGY